MTQEEINFTREEMKKEEAAAQGWTYLGDDGLWEYWENKGVIFWFSASDIGAGSETNMYTRKQIRMDG